MIRDEFKDVKKVSSKESRKKKEMGERNFYATQIPKLKDITHAMGVSTVITDVMLGLCYIMILLVYFLSRNTEEPYSTTKFIIWTAVFGACVIFNFVWFLIIKPHNLKKAERYKTELEKINRENLNKLASGYNKINK